MLRGYAYFTSYVSYLAVFLRRYKVFKRLKIRVRLAFNSAKSQRYSATHSFPRPCMAAVFLLANVTRTFLRRFYAPFNIGNLQAMIAISLAMSARAPKSPPDTVESGDMPSIASGKTERGQKRAGECELGVTPSRVFFAGRHSLTAQTSNQAPSI